MEKKITDVLYRYCAAVDTLDEREFLALWTPDARINFGARYDGDPVGFLASVRANRRDLTAMSHHVVNIRIELAQDGQSARSSCGVTAIIVPKPGSDREPRLVRGSYYDDWIHTDGQWLIHYRRFEKILELEVGHR